MYLKTASLLILLATASGLSYSVNAQTKTQTSIQSVEIIQVHHTTQKEIASRPLAGHVRVWDMPPTLTLIPHSPQAHTGKVWLESTDEGLHIWGKVQADEQGFHWPKEKSEMLSSDHVEVWLAGSPDVSMPAIGWGNQFGQDELASLTDCKQQGDVQRTDTTATEQIQSCERWYNEQVRYREYLPRLFVRQWLLAGAGRYAGGGNGGTLATGHSFEDFASTAWAGLSATLFPEDLPTALKPRQEDGFVAETDDEMRQTTRTDGSGKPYGWSVRSGYFFHVFIPYSAFPPVQQLKLTDLYLAVDVFSAASAGHKMGEYSSTAPARQWGKPETFNHLQLTVPHAFSFTPCDYKIEQDDLYGNKHAAWFFPTVPGIDADLHSTVALVNPAGGYMYEPAGISPEASQATYFWKKLANGATVCGPRLAWRNDAEIKRSKFIVDQNYLEAKSLPDGWSLLRSGPSTHTHSQFGSGMCGSCEIVDFDIFAVSPQGEITSALHIDQDLSGERESPSGADLSIAPDWTKITLYREFEEPNNNWTSVTYCLNGHVFEQCGESKKATPPDPANFKELRVND